MRRLNRVFSDAHSTDGPMKAESKPMNRSLHAAKAAKQDEFYTQYVDIQKEVEAYLEFDPNTSARGRRPRSSSGLRRSTSPACR
jgi:hypothetical protein